MEQATLSIMVGDGNMHAIPSSLSLIVVGAIEELRTWDEQNTSYSYTYDYYGLTLMLRVCI